MDALSAIRPFMPPAVRNLPLPQGSAEALTGAMPLKDLKELQALAPSTLSSPNISSVGGANGFGNMLDQFVGEVNAKQMASKEAVNGLLAGEGVPLHQAVISMEEASVSFQLMVEVRNKLLDAYQELMRMQM